MDSLVAIIGRGWERGVMSAEEGVMGVMINPEAGEGVMAMAE